MSIGFDMDEATSGGFLETAAPSGAGWRDLPFKFMSLLFILYIFLLWLIIVRFVWNDVQGRTTDKRFRLFSLSLVTLFNLPGLLLYLVLRPPADFKERERATLEAELLRLELKKLRREEKTISQNPGGEKRPEKLYEKEN